MGLESTTWAAADVGPLRAESTTTNTEIERAPRDREALGLCFTGSPASIDSSRLATLVAAGTTRLMAQRPRILLADDHGLLLEAFQTLLEPRYQIVGAFANGREVLEAAPALKPDVVVMDIAMPVMNGLDAGRLLRERLPRVRLVYLTVSDDPELSAAAFRIGASAYLLKSSAASELFDAIEAALAGRTYRSPPVEPVPGSARSATGAHAEKKRLTPRQREVLKLLAEGASMKAIARALGVTPRTVAFHKYQLMKEQNVTSNADLVRLAIKEGLTSV
jgi:DNA-binding NarL/FixJ family response regulator